VVEKVALVQDFRRKI